MSAGVKKTWRDTIKQHFSRELGEVCRLTLVLDPDRLMADADVIEHLTQAGFETVAYDGFATFRLDFEKRFRLGWELGQPTSPLVVVAASLDLDHLPYDLVSTAEAARRVLRLGLADIFPTLSPAPLQSLGAGMLDSLFEATSRLRPVGLGKHATCDFVLRHVFDIDLDAVSTPADILRVLVRSHYRVDGLPPDIADRLVDRLSGPGSSTGWPIADLVTNRGAFFRFLEGRWPVYVAKQLGLEPLSSPSTAGSTDLPFADKDVRAYVDALFVEGLLERTDVVTPDAAGESWIRTGIRDVSGADAVHRLRKLLPNTASSLPGGGASHQEWLSFARKWAEILALWGAADGQANAADRSDFQEASIAIDRSFAQWMVDRFSTLHNQPILPRPVMVHHVASYLAYRLGGSQQRKAALVVVDGLSLDQWVVARRTMPGFLPRPDEHAAFAWVPTLTTVSRQSLFAGTPPYKFADTINATASEPKRWQRFWANKDIASSQVGYLLQSVSMDDEELIEAVQVAATRPMVRCIGVVLKTVDDMIHGTVRGSSQLQRDVGDWASSGVLWKVLDALLQQRFDVVLTSDHGNVETVGIGRPKVGDLAEKRGERSIVFSDELLRDTVAKDIAGSVTWVSKALPPNFLPLLAPPRTAFTSAGELAMVHGGASLEEVIVPLVEFRANP